MTEIVAVGGFGSTLKQYQSLADRLHEKFGPDLAISGVNFLSALKDSQRLAETIDGRHVITHSAGAYAVASAVQLGAIPAHLDMLAPPSYELTPRLVLNALRYELAQRRQKSASTANKPHERSELLRHPQTHLLAVPSIGRFATMAFGATCQEMGVTTRIGVMEQDGIFSIDQYPAEELQRARQAGVKVSMLKGNHTRFTREPNAVLDELAASLPIEVSVQQSERPEHSLSAAVLAKLAILSSQASLAVRRVA